ncbi:MAG TPA: tRNA (adenosine(37)-N6)-threonylcarbamoyltransferase complex ATPase subunit type 1 TsaE [Candidatus Dormibacteraeota bacterium]|nr:tRNA (adenosine(37)-N6)-threonylcarbamoyltransferase complex ATPase subunit type 1 TsaE [Candidatus Dormibacteraeota bacterium]
MNSATTYKTSTTSSAATEKLGAKLGSLLRGGEVLELASDLGGGKTTLIRGVLRGLGYAESVPSPTFTISRVYKVRDNLEFHHFDFYRLGAGDIVDMELAEVLGDSRSIVAVEWGQHSGAGLPQERVRIHLEPGKAEDERGIIVEALSSKLNYIIEGLKK